MMDHLADEPGSFHEAGVRRRRQPRHERGRRQRDGDTEHAGEQEPRPPTTPDLLEHHGQPVSQGGHGQGHDRDQRQAVVVMGRDVVVEHQPHQRIGQPEGAHETPRPAVGEQEHSDQAAHQERRSDHGVNLVQPPFPEPRAVQEGGDEAHPRLPGQPAADEAQDVIRKTDQEDDAAEQRRPGHPVDRPAHPSLQGPCQCREGHEENGERFHEDGHPAGRPRGHEPGPPGAEPPPPQAPQ